MLGAAARQHLRPWRFEEREDQRVLGAVCAGAGGAQGPLDRSGVSGGLNATLGWKNASGEILNHA